MPDIRAPVLGERRGHLTSGLWSWAPGPWSPGGESCRGSPGQAAAEEGLQRQSWERITEGWPAGVREAQAMVGRERGRLEPWGTLSWWLLDVPARGEGPAQEGSCDCLPGFRVRGTCTPCRDGREAPEGHAGPPAQMNCPPHTRPSAPAEQPHRCLSALWSHPGCVTAQGPSPVSQAGPSPASGSGPAAVWLFVSPSCPHGCKWCQG